MSKCASVLKNLEWCQGKPVYAGIKRKIYLALVCDIVVWPEIARDASGRPSSATLTGNFVLAEGKKWTVLEHEPSKAEPNSESQGEYPGKTFKNALTAVCPEVGPDATLALALMQNAEVVAIAEDMEGRYRVYGNKRWGGAKVDPSQALGAAPTGSTASTVKIEATDEIPAPFYTGAIATAEGTVNEGATAGA